MTTDTAAESILLLDTSAAVALLLQDHEDHVRTTEAVRGRQLGLAGHAWFETYSVLTRLPAGLRRSSADTHRLLAHNFPASVHLAEAEAVRLGRELAALNVAGGAVYDALVGASARQHGLRLVSYDARARPTYEALGVRVELI